MLLDYSNISIQDEISFIIKSKSSSQRKALMIILLEILNGISIDTNVNTRNIDRFDVKFSDRDDDGNIVLFEEVLRRRKAMNCFLLIKEQELYDKSV